MKTWTPENSLARLNELAGQNADDRENTTRLHLLEVATEHFVRFGYRRANVGDIARDAGISKGAVYLHFDSKQALLIGAIAHEKLALMPAFEELFTLPVEQQLERFIRLSLEFTLTAPLTSRVLQGDPELERILVGMKDRWKDDQERNVQMLASMIAAVAPGLDELQRRTLGALLAVVLRLVVHHEPNELTTPFSKEAFVDLYTRVLTRGITGLEL